MKYKYLNKAGLSLETIRELSDFKSEDSWMRELRVKAYNHYVNRDVPTWGVDLAELTDKILGFMLSRVQKKREDGKRYLVRLNKHLLT